MPGWHIARRNRQRPSLRYQANKARSMTFAEKAALEQAYQDITALKAQIADMNAHVMAETERRMDLTQRVTALEAKPTTLTLKGR